MWQRFLLLALFPVAPALADEPLQQCHQWLKVLSSDQELLTELKDRQTMEQLLNTLEATKLMSIPKASLAIEIASSAADPLAYRSPFARKEALLLIRDLLSVLDKKEEASEKDLRLLVLELQSVLPWINNEFGEKDLAKDLIYEIRRLQIKRDPELIKIWLDTFPFEPQDGLESHLSEDSLQLLLVIGDMLNSDQLLHLQRPLLIQQVMGWLLDTHLKTSMIDIYSLESRFQDLFPEHQYSLQKHLSIDRLKEMMDILSHEPIETLDTISLMSDIETAITKIESFQKASLKLAQLVNQAEFFPIHEGGKFIKQKPAHSLESFLNRHTFHAIMLKKLEYSLESVQDLLNLPGFKSFEISYHERAVEQVNNIKKQMKALGMAQSHHFGHLKSAYRQYYSLGQIRQIRSAIQKFLSLINKASHLIDDPLLQSELENLQTETSKLLRAPGFLEASTISASQSPAKIATLGLALERRSLEFYELSDEIRITLAQPFGASTFAEYLHDINKTFFIEQNLQRDADFYKQLKKNAYLIYATTLNYPERREAFTVYQEHVKKELLKPLMEIDGFLVMQHENTQSRFYEIQRKKRLLERRQLVLHDLEAMHDKLKVSGEIELAKEIYYYHQFLESQLAWPKQLLLLSASTSTDEFEKIYKLLQRLEKEGLDLNKITTEQLEHMAHLGSAIAIKKALMPYLDPK